MNGVDYAVCFLLYDLGTMVFAAGFWLVVDAIRGGWRRKNPLL